MSNTDDLQQMEQILREESVGYLGMTAYGELYVIPINYTYVDRRILFHCALTGRKLDMIRANPNVCFSVGRQHGEPTEHVGRNCDAPFESVICWGTARVVDDLDERHAILQQFQQRYATPEKPRTELARERAAKCGAVQIVVTRMTGRAAQGKADARWEWSDEGDGQDRQTPGAKTD